MSSDSDPSRGAHKLASLRKLWDSRLMLGNPTHIEAPACCSSGPESWLGFGLKVCHRYSIDLCCHDEVILRETTCKQKCTCECFLWLQGGLTSQGIQHHPKKHLSASQQVQHV